MCVCAGGGCVGFRFWKTERDTYSIRYAGCIIMGCLSLCYRVIGLVEVKFDTALYLFVYLLTSSYYIPGGGR